MQIKCLMRTAGPGSAGCVQTGGGGAAWWNRPQDHCCRLEWWAYKINIKLHGHPDDDDDMKAAAVERLMLVANIFMFAFNLIAKIK